MYMWSGLSDTENLYIAINIKTSMDVIQRDELINLCHTPITRVILLLYAFQTILAGPKILKIFYSEKKISVEQLNPVANMETLTQCCK